MMTQRNNCIYCNKEITTRSSEHVIQNALGGLYESEDICCPECNNFISKYIDAPFTKIFNPIINKIENFSKSNNPKSIPTCTGKVMYQGKIYDANIRGGKVVSCLELSRELRTDASKLPLQIIAYDFHLDNEAFQTGIAKIAFNYAMAQNIDFKHLEHGLSVKKSNNGVDSINYNYKILPFCPMNPLDLRTEIEKPLSEPFHNMILFSQHNELWCYIDLFNTFQYYVLLSDSMPTEKPVYANYTQTVQKLNRNMPNIPHLYKPKDIMIYAQQYGVEPCMDMKEFLRRIEISIAKKSQKISMEKIYRPRIEALSVMNTIESIKHDPKLMHQMYMAMHLYFGDNSFQQQNFRTLTPVYGYDEIHLYPHAISAVVSQNPDMLSNYTMAKFGRLNQYLCKTK